MPVSDEKSKREKGLELAGKLLAGSTALGALPEEFSQLTIDHLFGDIWQRPGLELQERSLVTVTTLVATGREAELHIHLNGALNLGITREKLEATITHVAHYAGWPVAVSAMRVLGEICDRRDNEGA